ncbi:MAG: NAD(P)-dependent oxidoreductase [Candidatus Margulisbacteria bacterium]|nr:NAD(P)-dependent oxidoreductase [Candidatus Margulisiibacteriota bacterium]
MAKLLKKKTIFLTGGSGFIGRNILLSKLNNEYNILAPDHSQLDLTNDDQLEQFFKNHEIDTVIHAACKPGHRNAQDCSGIFYTNTRMFLNLARFAQYYKKMIITGSGAIYDSRFYKPKMKEDYFGQHLPDDEHGLSSYVKGRYIEQTTENIYDLRIFGIFGPYEDYAIRFISNAICKTLFHLPITIKQNRKFDYIFIDDLMTVLKYFIENKPKYKSYNVTPDKSIELAEIAAKIKHIAKKNVQIKIAKGGLGPEYSGNNDRLKKEMPSLHFTSIDEGISKLYNWYSERKADLKKELLETDK